MKLSQLIAHLLELESRATKMPWESFKARVHGWAIERVCYWMGEDRENDAKFIAESRNHIKELCEALTEVAQISVGLVKEWDGLGVHKDDDFGRVQEEMEELRDWLAKWEKE
jgi:hypothetical protein